MVTVAVPLPVPFVAVIVYVLVADVAVGVPEITPVEVLNDKPVGKAALIDQLVAAPPALAGVSDVMVAPVE